MTKIAVLLATGMLLLASQVDGDELEGNYLYRVSTVRAATGSLSNMLDGLKSLRESRFYEESGEPRPFIMRHSQGDQWDLMIVTPMGDFTRFYSADALERRRVAAEKYAGLITQVEDTIAFREENYALGPPVDHFAGEYRRNGFFHIEMFEAAPGKVDELMQQRRMENRYLTAIGLKANMIFRSVAGSDVDVFTIGFHEDLEAFAAPSVATDDEREAAAREAGFRDRADISFYLRSLLSGHHDTLAVGVE